MATTNYSRGGTLRIVAETALSSNDFVQVGAFFGVVQFDVASGEEAILAIEGVHYCPALGTEAWEQGDLLYYDGDALTLDDAEGANTLVAVAYVAKAASATTGIAKIGIIAQA